MLIFTVECAEMAQAIKCIYCQLRQYIHFVRVGLGGLNQKLKMSAMSPSINSINK